MVVAMHWKWGLTLGLLAWIMNKCLVQHFIITMKTGKECRTQQIGNDLIIPQEFAGALNFRCN